jgi:ketosteroid isomerase-like protein
VCKTLVRTMIRRDIARLNDGDYQSLRSKAADDAELTFPGDNSWSRQFRPPRRSHDRYATHRGIAELEAFAQRFIDDGLRIDIHDVLVAGPPWNTRICVRGTDRLPGNETLYSNRVVLFIEARWGRIHRWEDYLDTERIADWDRQRDGNRMGHQALRHGRRA